MGARRRGLIALLAALCAAASLLAQAPAPAYDIVIGLAGGLLHSPLGGTR
jgi:hypothetical protein